MMMNNSKKELDHLCRACMSKNQVLRSLSDEAPNVSLTFYEIFATTMPQVPIDNVDELPKKICADCVTTLIIVHRFHQMCIESDTYMRSLLVSNILEQLSIPADLPEDITQEMVQSPAKLGIPIAELTPMEQEISKSDELGNLVSLEPTVKCEYDNVADSGCSFGDNNKTDDVYGCFEASRSRDTELAGSVDKPIHSGSKRYKCKYCEKSCSSKAILKIHTAMHISFGERSYDCNECDKKFSRSAYLRKHRRVHTGYKPYKCSYCEKSFSSKSTLINHLRTHTGERPYECTECNKTFAQSISLKTHQRIHTGDKPYKCKLCDRAFAHRKSIIRHTRTHTGERPYKCDVCNKAFSCSNVLRRHELIHTKALIPKRRSVKAKI